MNYENFYNIVFFIPGTPKFICVCTSRFIVYGIYYCPFFRSSFGSILAVCLKFNMSEVNQPTNNSNNKAFMKATMSTNPILLKCYLRQTQIQ